VCEARSEAVRYRARGLHHCSRNEQRANFGVKLARPGSGPAAELPTVSPVSRRHGGCTSRLGSANVIRGNRRAALP